MKIAGQLGKINAGIDGSQQKSASLDEMMQKAVVGASDIEASGMEQDGLRNEIDAYSNAKDNDRISEEQLLKEQKEALEAQQNLGNLSITA